MWVRVLFSRVELKAALDLSFFCLLIHLSPFFLFRFSRCKLYFHATTLASLHPASVFFWFFLIYIFSPLAAGLKRLARPEPNRFLFRNEMVY